jgi:predicted ArsR family transcriptional regulator
MASVLSGTRLQIARLLQRDGTDTVESLADKLGLAAATVRRHLDIMQRDGVAILWIGR